MPVKPPFKITLARLAMSQRRLISALGILVGLMLLPQAGMASLRFTEATGRAVIQPGADPSEARMIALEDALYLAALQGGATVDGFSAINTDTSLTDQVVVRPASKIMDYAVINEVIDGDHFAVTIRAAVGDLTQNKCQRPNINLTLFKPVFDIDQKIPAWAATFRTVLAEDVTSALTAHSKFSVVNATSTVFAKSSLSSAKDAYDYSALTGGKISVGDGDFALVPEIQIKRQRIAGVLVRQESIAVTVNLHGYQGRTYAPAFVASHSKIIDIKRTTPLSLVDTLTRKSRHQLTAEMRSIVQVAIQSAVTKMVCQPLRARLNKGKDNKTESTLSVPFGRRHGVTQNSLAVTDQSDSGWTVLKIARLAQSEAQLVPLDPKRDISKLVGKTVEFMELSR